MCPTAAAVAAAAAAAAATSAAAADDFLFLKNSEAKRHDVVTDTYDRVRWMFVRVGSAQYRMIRIRPA